MVLKYDEATRLAKLRGYELETTNFSKTWISFINPITDIRLEVWLKTGEFRLLYRCKLFIKLDTGVIREFLSDAKFRTYEDHIKLYQSAVKEVDYSIED